MGIIKKTRNPKKEEKSAMPKSWMSELAAHYEATKQRFPNDKLLILFDIDGTILDMRYLVLHVLHRYDRVHGTHYFQQLGVDDITVHENQIAPLLSTLNIPVDTQAKLLHWFEAEAWSPTAMLEAHRPFAGVLEVIRWFQMQPNTAVGLNTGRLNAIRDDTLRSLNRLGQDYKVTFSNELLYMNLNAWEVPVAEAKISGIRYFQQMGYRVVAFIDNEPGNLNAVSGIDPNHEILLLHADTIFQSRPAQLPARAIPGTQYDLTDLIPEHALPRHIQLVWRTINDPGNLAQFLASDVYWGEFDVHLPANGSPAGQSSSWLAHWLLLERVLWRLRNRNKGIKLNLTETESHVIGLLIELLQRYGFTGVNLWFSVNLNRLEERDFKHLTFFFPGAVIEANIDDLAPAIRHDPSGVRAKLQKYQSWGINRFGVSWYTPDLRNFVDKLTTRGFDIDIFDVKHLEAFLQAVLLSPGSITTTFNFPKWSYFGIDVSESFEDSNMVSVP
jgi:hypothetical protein